MGACIIMLLLHFSLQTGLIRSVRKPVCSTRHVSANVQASCWVLGQQRITKFPRTWTLQSRNPLCLYFWTETATGMHTCQSHLLYRQEKNRVNHSMEKKRNVQIECLLKSVTLNIQSSTNRKINSAILCWSTLPIRKRDYSRQDKLQTAICCCHQQAHSSI